MKPEITGTFQEGQTMRASALGKLALLGVVVSLGAGVTSSRALPLDNRMMYIGFSKPVALPGVELNAGTYVFELATPTSDSSLVRVLSQDRKKIYLTAFTTRVDRPRTLREGQVVTFG